MEATERENWIRMLKESPLRADPGVELSYGRDQIEQMLPQRPPFAFIDRVVQVDLEHQVIVAEAEVKKDDPVFAGHFPDYPVYPGVLQVETMGQAGLCLIHFLQNGSIQIDGSGQPVKGMFTRIHHTAFIHPVLPGDRVTLRAKVIELDDFLGIMGMQLCKSDQICANCILEAYFMD